MKAHTKRRIKLKYLNCLAGIAGRYQKEYGQVINDYDIGAVKINVEAAFLSELDAERIFDRLKGKVERNERLSDEERMELIIFPLSYRRQEEKQERDCGAGELKEIP